MYRAPVYTPPVGYQVCTGTAKDRYKPYGLHKISNPRFKNANANVQTGLRYRDPGDLVPSTAESCMCCNGSTHSKMYPDTPFMHPYCTHLLAPCKHSTIDLGLIQKSHFLVLVLSFQNIRFYIKPARRYSVLSQKWILDQSRLASSARERLHSNSKRYQGTCALVGSFPVTNSEGDRTQVHAKKIAGGRESNDI